MKKFAKSIAVFLAFMMAISAFSICGNAVATPLEAGSSMSNAANIPAFGVDYVSTLSESEEVDWFKFTTLDKEAFYNFYFENYSLANTGTWNTIREDSPQIYLYDSNMRELKSAFTDGDKTAEFNLKLETSTVYYIKVFMGKNNKDSTGNYQITVSSREDNVPDSMDKAVAVNLNKTVISSLDGYADTDWFKFTTNNNDTAYEITFTNYDLANTGSWNTIREDSPHIRIYDVNDQELYFEFTPSSKTVTFKAELEKGTEYFIKINMGSNRLSSVGNYEFTVSSDTVATAVLSRISVESMPTKTVYAVGDSFDASGLIIKAYYSDGTSVNLSNYSLSTFDSSTVGTKTIVVSYSESGKTVNCEFEVEVQENNADFDFLSVFLNIFKVIADFFMMIIDIILGAVA